MWFASTVLRLSFSALRAKYKKKKRKKKIHQNFVFEDNVKRKSFGSAETWRASLCPAMGMKYWLEQHQYLKAHQENQINLFASFMRFVSTNNRWRLPKASSSISSSDIKAFKLSTTMTTMKRAIQIANECLGSFRNNNCKWPPRSDTNVTWNVSSICRARIEQSRNRRKGQRQAEVTQIITRQPFNQLQHPSCCSPTNELFAQIKANILASGGSVIIGSDKLNNSMQKFAIQIRMAHWAGQRFGSRCSNTSTMASEEFTTARASDHYVIIRQLWPFAFNLTPVPADRKCWIVLFFDTR